MTYFSNAAVTRLQQAFLEDNLLIAEQSDHIVAENSMNHTDARIRELVTKAGSCPLISPNRTKGNFVFTVTPFQIPENFQRCVSTDAQDVYFTKDELTVLLKDNVIERTTHKIEDSWELINAFRNYVTPALNKGLFEIISQCAKDKCPIIEIGSGIGYSLVGDLATRVIRTQPALDECQLLCRDISAPVYQRDVQGLYESLFPLGKKIPLFFGLNVFDTMTPEQRMFNLSLLSQLQEKGDKILVMLDTNPLLCEMIRNLESRYPNHRVLPFFLHTSQFQKQRVIIVPSHLMIGIPLEREDIMANNEGKLLFQGQISQRQWMLHQLQKEHDLKVIVVEDFFLELMKEEFEKVGYSSKSFYHASFALGENQRINQDLLYKTVTDISTIRQWSLTDQNFLNVLSEKGLQLPKHFDDTHLRLIRGNAKKLLGVEILVIEATKQ